ncbi:MAG: 4Fe-4S dicluster domain-containing protein [Paeniclostridium sp.]
MRKCGKCEKACPIDAISLIKDENGNKKIDIDYDVCLGCGVCARNCHKGSIILKEGKKIITPSSSVHRVVLQAIEKRLCYLISELRL